MHAARHASRGVYTMFWTLTFFTESLEKGVFILEELIIQGEELSVMYPQSINSFRVVTLLVMR